MAKKADEKPTAEAEAAETLTPEEKASVGELLEAMPEAMAMLPAVADDAEAVFRRMALEDERQILEELQGRALDVMLYSFEIDGKRQTGLSWKGTREAVRTLNARGWTAIKMDPRIEPKFEEVIDEEGDDAIRVVVYAIDEKSGGGNWGLAQQKKKMKLRGGRQKPDTFASHKALSKAQRNAFEALVPAEVVEYLKAQFLGRPDQVKVIPGAATAVEVERPPALTDERATEQMNRIRSLYDEIKEIDRVVMPPGQFNALLMGAQHSHDRLDETIAHLETFRDSEREIATVRDRFRGMVEPDVYERELGKLNGLSQARRLASVNALVEKAEKAAGS